MIKLVRCISMHSWINTKQEPNVLHGKDVILVIMLVELDRPKNVSSMLAQCYSQFDAAIMQAEEILGKPCWFDIAGHTHKCLVLPCLSFGLLQGNTLSPGGLDKSDCLRRSHGLGCIFV